MAGDGKKIDPTWRTQTKLVRGGLGRSEYRETAEAIYMTSGFVYDSAEDAENAFNGSTDRYIYTRYGNPTVTSFQKRMCLLEGAESCTATSSGMSAVFYSLLALLRAGDRLVASKALFGSCDYIVSELLPRYGVETELVSGTNIEQWERALTKPTQAVFVETPSNPTLEIIDLPKVAELAHTAGAKLVVDNVVATPILQKPLKLGADVVIYSATKHIDGQGRALAGAILGTQEYYDECLQPFIRHTGPSCSPFNAWLMLKGLETLELRVERHCRNTIDVAHWLEKQHGIDKVIYPGLLSHPQYDIAKKQMSDSGSVLSFQLEGGKKRAFSVLNALKMIDISNNLGDTKSIVTHPATTTHQRLTPEGRGELGITDGLVRLSVGLEDPQDIKDDLAQALAR
ncbi:MAG: O-succinylhomoserine sulfhydrylase [Rhodospirillaceae bacterium]|nr:O-succinylhomoserine sulfhydrylase [Rhodospirillaceae bacterium]|tara:strand:- start:1024 stop:2220 length:1197 start_codon:yes stop_codon:yes gene_type:complete